MTGSNYTTNRLNHHLCQSHLKTTLTLTTRTRSGKTPTLNRWFNTSNSCNDPPFKNCSLATTMMRLYPKMTWRNQPPSKPQLPSLPPKTLTRASLTISRVALWLASATNLHLNVPVITNRKQAFQVPGVLTVLIICHRTSSRICRSKTSRAQWGARRYSLGFDLFNLI